MKIIIQSRKKSFLLEAIILVLFIGRFPDKLFESSYLLQNLLLIFSMVFLCLYVKSSRAMENEIENQGDSILFDELIQKIGFTFKGEMIYCIVYMLIFNFLCLFDYAVLDISQLVSFIIGYIVNLELRNWRLFTYFESRKLEFKINGG